MSEAFEHRETPDPAQLPEQKRRRRIYPALLALGLLLDGGVMGALIEKNFAERTRASARPVTTGVIPRVDMEAAQHGTISAQRWQKMHDATVHIEVKAQNPTGTLSGWSCTGTFLNQAVVTAKHCLTGDGVSQITDISMYQGPVKDENKAMEGLAWATSPSKDLAAIKVNFIRSTPTLYAPTLSSDAPTVGQEYYLDSLPESTVEPVSVPLTYVGVYGNSGEYILAQSGTKNPEACHPGASGSLMSDGANRYGVLVATQQKASLSQQDWNSAVSYAQSLNHIVIYPKKTEALCFMVPVSGDDLTALYTPLQLG